MKKRAISLRMRAVLAVVVGMAMLAHFAVGLGLANSGNRGSGGHGQTVTGAIYTTTAGCADVNQNVKYESKQHVYLSGGPTGKGNSNRLSPDGLWYWQITDPNGSTLLSTQPLEQRVVKVEGGKIVAYVGGGGNLVKPCPDGRVAVQAFPFDDTPNPGGEYKAWMTPVKYYNNGFVGKYSKTDNFKVKEQKPNEAELTLVKHVDNKKGGDRKVSDFKLTVSGNGVNKQVASGQTIKLVPGTYSIAETTKDRYAPSGWKCGDEKSPQPAGATSRQVTLKKGDKLTCYMTNTYTPPQTGTIVIKKHVMSGDKGKKFSFSTNVPGHSPELKHDGKHVMKDVPAGNKVTITENVPADWKLHEISCKDEKGKSHGSKNGNTVTVEAKKDRTITCVFKNKHTPPPSGTIIIKKVVSGSGAPDESFRFNTNVAGHNPSLKHGKSHEIANVAAGTAVTIAETLPTGDNWVLADVTCKSGAKTHGKRDGNKVTVTAVSGKTITCTFTNKYTPPPLPSDGKIKVIKKVVGGDAMQDFAFATNVAAGFTLKHDGVEVLKNLANGQEVTITETLPTTGDWALTSAVCKDKSNKTVGSLTGTTMTVAAKAGETITCTFTNKFTPPPAATVIIKKVVATSGAPAETFSFSTTVPGHNPTLAHGDGHVIGNVTGGEPITITENLTADGHWALDSVVCTDKNDDPVGSPSGLTVTVTPAAGDTITCVFTNSYDPPAPTTGNVVIKKIAIGGTPGETFAFTTNIGHSPELELEHEQTYQMANLAGGTTVEVTERDHADTRWELDSAVCTDENGDTVGTVNGATATVTVIAGETITCVYTNKYRTPDPGHLVIVKQASGGNGDETFNFTSAEIGNFALQSGQSETASNLAAETVVTVTEVVPDDWRLTSVTCTDGTNSVGEKKGDSVEVAMIAGKTITCTFANEYNPPTSGDEAKILVRKSVLNGNPNLKFDFTSDAGDFALSDDEETTLTGLSGGDVVAITEVLPSDWTLVSIVCEDGDGDAVGVRNGATVTVTAIAGDEITCVFTNNYTPPDDDPDTGTITVRKEVTRGSETQAFTFTTNVAAQPSFQLSHNEQKTIGNLSTDQTVTITENLPAFGNWQLQSVTCTDDLGNSHGTRSGRTMTVQPVADRHITCTFSNRTMPVIPPPGDPPGDNPPGDDPPGDDPPGDDPPDLIPPPPPSGPPTDTPPDDETTFEIPPPSAPPDLPFTGGLHVWSLVGGSALTTWGGARLLRPRRRDESSERGEDTSIE